MPDIKLKLKDLGTIHLMALDSSSLFLPFGRPISDYLRGEAGNQNGSKALLKQGPIDFSPAVRWNESITLLLRTTGFGELEQEGLEGLSEPGNTPSQVSDPPVAGFLSFEPPSASAMREPDPAIISPAMAYEGVPITLPRVTALPLRPRMTFGPPPQKAKPAPAVASKPASPQPMAKAGPAIVAAPPKQSANAPAKPAAPTSPAKAPAPTATPAKPAAPIPPAPKPGGTAAPATRVTVLQPPAASTPKTANPRTSVPIAPAARAPEMNPAPAKSSPTPSRAPISPSTRPTENVVSSLDSAVLAKSPAGPPKITKATSSKPLAPPLPAERVSAPAELMELAPAREVIPREAPKEKESHSVPRAKGGLSIIDSTPAPESVPAAGFEPKLGAADSGSLLERIPMAVKIGVALLVAAVVIYFGTGKSGGRPVQENRAVFVGEQGWTTEWASDTVGSRRARQLTLYRPSAGMADYQFQFVGQIESKAIGWVFRALDTKNYYAMKIENIRPGAMALTHFAVVDGRESSNAQKPLTVDARPGATYRVKLDVNGPRFTVSIQGEPVDFWTDNRLKAGSVGLMNERDERGVASAVQFSFPHVAK